MTCRDVYALLRPLSDILQVAEFALARYGTVRSITLRAAATRGKLASTSYFGKHGLQCTVRVRLERRALVGHAVRAL